MKGSIVLQYNILWSFNDSKQRSFVGAQPAAAALQSKFGEQLQGKKFPTVCKKIWYPFIATLSPNQLEICKSAAHITSYEPKQLQPNQTKPKFTTSIRNDSIATLRPNQLEFLKSIAYITSYEQERHLPNQTKPNQTKIYHIHQKRQHSHPETKSVGIFEIRCLYHQL